MKRITMLLLGLVCEVYCIAQSPVRSLLYHDDTSWSRTKMEKLGYPRPGLFRDVSPDPDQVSYSVLSTIWYISSIDNEQDINTMSSFTEINLSNTPLPGNEETRLCLRKSFHQPVYIPKVFPLLPSFHLLLHLDGLASETAEVWVNGKRIENTDSGGAFDITSALRSQIQDQALFIILPKGQREIPWKMAWLESVRETYISSYQGQNDSFDNSAVLTVNIENPSEEVCSIVCRGNYQSPSIPAQAVIRIPIQPEWTESNDDGPVTIQLLRVRDMQLIDEVSIPVNNILTGQSVSRKVKIDFHNLRFVDSSIPLSSKDVSPDFWKQYRTFRVLKIAGAIGLLFSVAEIIDSDITPTIKDQEPFSVSYIEVGSLIVSGTTYFISSRKLIQLRNRFNEQHDRTLSVNLISNNNGVGVAFVF